MLALLSAEAREFFAATTAEIEQLTDDVEAVLGERGKIVDLLEAQPESVLYGPRPSEEDSR